MSAPRRLLDRSRAATVAVLFSLVAGCADHPATRTTDARSPSSSGGAKGSGGATGSGGAAGSGGVTGSAGATGSGGATGTVPSFPLGVSGNGRYLQDANGVPFPILGDAGWEAPHNLTSSDQQTYLKDRTGRGFNAVMVEAIEHKFTSKKPPMDLAGNLPFTKRLDGSTYTGSPNGTSAANGNGSQFAADPYSNVNTQAPDFTYPTSAYWAQLDAFISLGAGDGVEVFMFPAYVGYAGGDEGWMSEMVANDAAAGVGGFGAQPWSNAAKSKLWNYGAWLAQHYAAFTNIVWVLGGDFGTGASGAFSTADANAVTSLLAGMKSVAGQRSHLWTSHWGRPSLGSDLGQFASFMDLQSVYENNSASSQARDGYSASPVKPAFELENYYEGDPSGGEPDRKFQWWSFLGDIAGQFYANAKLWLFTPGWQPLLGSQGGNDMAQLNSFVRSLPWQDLVPSGLNGQKTVVTANGSSPGSADYVACAVASGTVAVCYVPPSWALTNLTVDSTVMSAAYRARWLNPTTGAYSAIGANIANTGTHVFTPPGNNGSTYSDWVLVLDVI